MSTNVTAKNRSCFIKASNFLKKSLEKLAFKDSYIEYPYRLLKITEVSEYEYIFLIQISKMNKVFQINAFEFPKKTDFVNSFSPSDILLMYDYVKKVELAPQEKICGYDQDSNTVTFRSIRTKKLIKKNLFEVTNNDIDQMSGNDAAKITFLKNEIVFKEEEKEKQDLINLLKKRQKD
ncbi:MAG TPA: hypothetical protein QF753_07220 [Victivallales bacterium]|nr:hypothetical protein [Victivallales bacterium]